MTTTEARDYLSSLKMKRDYLTRTGFLYGTNNVRPTNRERAQISQRIQETEKFLADPLTTRNGSA